MPSAANLRTLLWEDLPVLRDLYRVEWPKYAYTFYTLDTCYNWRELARNGEVEVFTDPERDWQTTGTFVLRVIGRDKFCNKITNKSSDRSIGL